MEVTSTISTPTKFGNVMDRDQWLMEGPVTCTSFVLVNVQVYVICTISTPTKFGNVMDRDQWLMEGPVTCTSFVFVNVQVYVIFFAQ